MRITFVAGMVLASMLLAASARGSAILEALGDLPDGTVSSTALRVSGDGSVVVGWSSSTSGDQAFRWTSGGGMVGLGDLPGGSFASYGNGVNYDGSVVAGYSNSTFDQEAFLWTSAGGMVGLGDLPGGSFVSNAFGVSADGTVIVGGGQSASGGEAYRWTSSGGMVGLGDLPGGSFSSGASGVSSDGSVVVGTSVSAGSLGFEAFRWTPGTGMVGLGMPAGGISRAMDVSGDGLVVVGIIRPQFALDEAFRWTSDEGLVGLGYLPGGSSISEANGVNGDGSVVVGRAGQDSFIWTAGTGMQRLWDLLLAQGVDPAASGWTRLNAASDVSLDGAVVVGFGTRNGNREAFRAVIPEPSGLGLILIPITALRRRG